MLHLYRTDAWILISAGLIGGKGVDQALGANPKLFITLTAPSFGAVHRRRPDGSCHPSAQRFCEHGSSLRCLERHEDDAVILGQALCPDCFDYGGAIRWNAHASKLFASSMFMLRRRLVAS